MSALPVCVVDDDDDVRDALSELLRACGYSVRDYPSAQSFLSDSRRDKVACLVLDLHMPELGGLELLELLKRDKNEVPVIVMTGQSDAHLMDRARRAGTVAFLHKPFDEAMLLEAINRACRV